MFCPIFAQNYQNGNNQKEDRALLDIVFSLCCSFLFCIPVTNRFLLFNGTAIQYYFPGQGFGPDVIDLDQLSVGHPKNTVAFLIGHDKIGTAYK